MCAELKTPQQLNLHAIIRCGEIMIYSLVVLLNFLLYAYALIDAAIVLIVQIFEKVTLTATTLDDSNL